MSQSSSELPSWSRLMYGSKSQQATRDSMSLALSLYSKVNKVRASSHNGSGSSNSEIVGATLWTMTQPLTVPLVSPSSSKACITITCGPFSDQLTGTTEVGPVVVSNQLGSICESGCHSHRIEGMSFGESSTNPSISSGWSSLTCQTCMLLDSRMVLVSTSRN